MSARDRFKAANNNFVKLGSESNKETIVDDIINDLDKAEEKSSVKENIPVVEVNSVAPITPVTSVTPVAPVTSSPLVEVTDKSRVGRPSQGESKNLSVKLKIENYYHARLVGGKYGGMTAYINYLIEQDRKKGE